MGPALTASLFLPVLFFCQLFRLSNVVHIDSDYGFFTSYEYYAGEFVVIVLQLWVLRIIALDKSAHFQEEKVIERYIVE